MMRDPRHGPVMDCPRLLAGCQLQRTPGTRLLAAQTSCHSPHHQHAASGHFLSKHDLDYRCHGLYHIGKKIQLSFIITHFDFREVRAADAFYAGTIVKLRSRSRSGEAGEGQVRVRKVRVRSESCDLKDLNINLRTLA